MCWWRAWRLSTGSRRRSIRPASSWRAGCRRTSPADLNSFLEKYRTSIAEDVDGDPVYLARSQFDLEWVRERNDKVRFVDIKETQRKAA